MIKWKIWYENFEVEGITLDDWNNAPDEGVIAIVKFLEKDEYGFNRYIVYSSVDWYWMLDNDIFSNSDSSEEINTWVDCVIPEFASIKKGKYVSNERMIEVNNEIFILIGS